VLDSEVVVFLDDGIEAELIFKHGEESIAFDFAVDTTKVEFRTLR
jgi:hypothetical protein